MVARDKGEIKMAKRKPFHVVTEELTSDKGLTIKDKIAFHYFNPNGLYSKKRAVDAQVRDCVDRGWAPWGFIMAYGSLNNYWVDQFTALHSKKSVSKMDLQVALSLLADDIERSQHEIDQVVFAVTEGI